MVTANEEDFGELRIVKFLKLFKQKNVYVLKHRKQTQGELCEKLELQYVIDN